MNGVFRISIFKQLMTILCGTVFLSFDCRLIASTLYCFALRVWEWNNGMGMGIIYGNGNKT